jgi:hypothetical protein
VLVLTAGGFVMKRSCLIFTAALLVVMVSACAGPNTATHVTSPEGYVAGFWFGLWNGLTAPFAFVASLFIDGVNFYEVHNNGGWYNFGFVLGSGILFRGSSRSSK